VVNLLYFSGVIGCAMVLIHPVCLAVSLSGALIWSVLLNGNKAIRFNLLYMLPMLIIAALINVAFNHRGATILRYLPNGNPLTLESILYGCAAAVMLVTVIAWFSCYTAVMTSDKFVYLFGRVIPALSLVLAMALRLVPRFIAQMKVIANAQQGIGRDLSRGNVLCRARNGLNILSIMLTWALENAIDTADSMKARGYGLPGRTAFSLFRFDRRDIKVLLFILVCGVYILRGALWGGLNFSYFPRLRGSFSGVYSLSLFMVYFALTALPAILNIKEDAQWRRLQSHT
jgi:energy-coupling factor transport system permease protein